MLSPGNCSRVVTPVRSTAWVAPDGMEVSAGIGGAAAAVCVMAAFAVKAMTVGRLFTSRVGAAGWPKPGTTHAMMANNIIDPEMNLLIFTIKSFPDVLVGV